MNIKKLLLTLLIICSMSALSVSAQVANDRATWQAIIEALPEGVTSATASADQIAQAAMELAIGMDGEITDNMTQVMVSLGELTREGTFKSAPRFGSKNPPGRLYTKVLNLASSALDVSYNTYYGITVQHIMALTTALRDGQNFLVGAESNAITRK
ncbi:hypothetical protein N8600_06715 [Gammaproteobacteria bacterium]|nr:hypothetical protein [Gammaproteobacteria bacterium]